jgi:hypothetical protein
MDGPNKFARANSRLVDGAHPETDRQLNVVVNYYFLSRLCRRIDLWRNRKPRYGRSPIKPRRGTSA